MEMGMVGLGKMGANMTTRLIKAGHRIVATDRNPEAVRSAVGEGARGTDSLEALVEELDPHTDPQDGPAGSTVSLTY